MLVSLRKKVFGKISSKIYDPHKVQDCSGGHKRYEKHMTAKIIGPEVKNYYCENEMQKIFKGSMYEDMESQRRQKWLEHRLKVQPDYKRWKDKNREKRPKKEFEWRHGWY
ncbi:hypothetical protein MHBO_002315 [Bonamia ostreae]|uniref:NADH dehydrogenase [ubiquinone] 1 beta subcomplex subunit 10 n=1 Tax=Bonamia ostreae TaxID=126728 RepID=A0ABV2ALW2_9EUKA